VAGACFILPAALIVGAVAWAYVRYGALPEAAGLLYGVKPVVIAVVLQALWGLGRSAVKSATLAALGVGAAAAAGLGAHELAVLGAAGAASALLHRARAPRAGGPPGSGLTAWWLAAPPAAQTAATASAAAAGGAAAAAPLGLWGLFGVFAKIGAVLFGSGYVLLAFLRADLVERLGWLTERQLLDAVAVGQVTPGPVFTTATFVGYVLGGPAGAAAADGRHLPAGVRVRGAERPARAAPAAVADRGRGARRRERRLARADGRGRGAARARGAGRPAHGRAGRRERAAARPLARELGLAGAGRRGGRAARRDVGRA
jgi:chromate transporter